MTRAAGANLSVHFWGVRGSIPVADPRMLAYGGNTACVEVRLPSGRSILFDAGTGLRAFDGSRSPGSARLHIFLTHFHLDHIQGLPFFPPLRDPRCEVHIHGPAQRTHDLSELLGPGLFPLYFPVPFLRSESIERLIAVRAGDAIEVDDAVVDSMRVCHPSETHAYRLRYRGIAIVFAPDNELGAMEKVEKDAFSAFCAGADLLIHDAMYREDEYATREGWGHSTYEQAIRFAQNAGVRALSLFHHAPDRTDGELDRLLITKSRLLRKAESGMRLMMAREGGRIELRGPAVEPVPQQPA